MGQGEYFVLDREYGVHWVLGSWLNTDGVLAYVKEKEQPEADRLVESLFRAMVEDRDPESEAVSDTLLYHLHVYYYLKQEGRIHGDALTKLNPALRLFLQYYLEHLVRINPGKANSVRNDIQLIQSRGGLPELLI